MKKYTESRLFKHLAGRGEILQEVKDLMDDKECLYKEWESSQAGNRWDIGNKSMRSKGYMV